MNTNMNMPQTCEHMLNGNLTTNERTWLVGLGAGMVLFGLTRNFPVACVLGTIGCVLAAEGLANANLRQVGRRVEKMADDWGVTERVQEMAGSMR